MNKQVNIQQTNEIAVDSSNCSICLSPINDPTTIQECNHLFCFECIDSWSKNKNECPLCKIEIKSLYKLNSQEITTVLEPKKPNPSLVDVDLACLDNRYFLEEIEKLLTQCQLITIQLDNIQPSGGNKVYFTKKMNDQDIKTLETIMDNLFIKKKSLEQYENAFDPDQVLSELYMYDETINDLKRTYLSHLYNNSSNNNNSNNNNSSNKKKHNNNNNNRRNIEYSDEYEYYDDDEDEDVDYEDRFYDNNTNNNEKRYVKKK
ncbi:hypothetical protein CYY_007394 [Polysphondylium violaceum]|uniref:RING-type E3 ubiquitin transferase n=1 Tax=Polysphondylium violaceum TaxID=133409 RepID=A0A8J4PQH6_9MYCE|nr:hypothetical protein CYY_007394 [Polysphondylium violaceum]